MKILWLDDDAPRKPFTVGLTRIMTASTCAEAEKILKRGKLPEWIIIDLIVPQGDWGNRYFAIPGLEFLSRVAAEYKEKIQIAAYSIAINPETRRKLEVAGASKIYAKTETSFMGVINELRELEATMSLEHKVKSDKERPRRDDIPRDELTEIIGNFINENSLSPHPLSEEKLRELHQAKLAIERNDEKRLRSYQMLDAMKARRKNVTTDESYATQDDLDQLQSTMELIVNEKRACKSFDVFLSYNSVDGNEVESVATRLKKNGILPWFDRWEIKPGIRWQRELEKQIESIRSASVFVGANGIGPWQQLEIEALLSQFVQRGCPVIPVLLQSAGVVPKLPLFLAGTNWVDFRQSDPNPLQKLIRGIIV